MVPIEVIQRYDREMDRKTRMNMERFAEFMARMIEKYGKIKKKNGNRVCQYKIFVVVLLKLKDDMFVRVFWGWFK